MATDAEIVEVAREADETIVTHDLDFGHLLALSGAGRAVAASHYPPGNDRGEPGKP